MKNDRAFAKGACWIGVVSSFTAFISEWENVHDLTVKCFLLFLMMAILIVIAVKMVAEDIKERSSGVSTVGCDSDVPFCVKYSCKNNRKGEVKRCQILISCQSEGPAIEILGAEDKKGAGIKIS